MSYLNYFEEVIGQEKAKRFINEKLLSFSMTGMFPPSLLMGGSGNGKSLMAKKIAKSISEIEKERGESGRILVNIDPGISTPTKLIENAILPYINGDRKIVYFFDECHGYPEKVVKVLLTMVEPKIGGYSEVAYDGGMLTIDFSRVAFIFATTEYHRVFHALDNRLEKIEMLDYTREELCQIISLYLDKEKIKVNKSTLECAADYVRNSGRGAYKMASHMASYAKARKLKTLNADCFNAMREALSIAPLGLEMNEIRALKILKDTGSLTLTQLAGRLKMPPQALQKRIETYPMSLGFMTIEGKRKITEQGCKYLSDIEKNVKSLLT